MDCVGFASRALLVLFHPLLFSSSPSFHFMIQYNCFATLEDTSSSQALIASSRLSWPHPLGQPARFAVLIPIPQAFSYHICLCLCSCYSFSTTLPSSSIGQIIFTVLILCLLPRFFTALALDTHCFDLISTALISLLHCALY